MCLSKVFAHLCGKHRKYLPIKFWRNYCFEIIIRQITFFFFAVSGNRSWYETSRSDTLALEGGQVSTTLKKRPCYDGLMGVSKEMIVSII